MTSPYGVLTLVCNVNAGGGGVGKCLPEVERLLAERGLEYEVLRTEAPGHATLLAKGAVERGRQLIVGVGGDGTVHEVVNGLIEDDKAINPEVRLGVVAAGTGCDFIKTFGIPSSPSHAVVHLDGHESFPIDIGKITFTEDGKEVVRYFANVAEAGLGARVVERAARLPRFLGPTLYFFAFWLSLARHKPAEVRVDLMTRTYEGPMNNMVIANGQFFGGGMKIAPKAAPTDGVLDFQIQHVGNRDAIAVLPKVYKGQHVPHPKILEAKRVEASIESNPPLLIEADGEVLGFTPARFELLRDAIHLKV
ncbi:MAG: YegS/Rv2252/BmrU family lipid kinase [Actinobacteria bacterium]|nr:YegS/Rv2252/BmrU family lipid kinase [Actinomycetota bacterium]